MGEGRVRSGTIELVGLPADGPALPGALAWDPRAACPRPPAQSSADVLRALARAKLTCDDRARDYTTLDTGARVRREPRPYQREALEAWRQAGGCGVVVLPTGAGKTLVAELAIDDRRRSTLVVT